MLIQHFIKYSVIMLTKKNSDDAETILPSLPRAVTIRGKSLDFSQISVKGISYHFLHPFPGALMSHSGPRLPSILPGFYP